MQKQLRKQQKVIVTLMHILALASDFNNTQYRHKQENMFRENLYLRLKKSKNDESKYYANHRFWKAENNTKYVLNENLGYQHV